MQKVELSRHEIIQDLLALYDGDHNWFFDWLSTQSTEQLSQYRSNAYGQAS